MNFGRRTLFFPKNGDGPMRSKRILVLLVMMVMFFQTMHLIVPQVEVLETAYGAGQVNVSGIISENTTWENISGPYIVKGHILVDENTTLTIEPGVMVKFDGYYYIMIRGDLVAKGTEDEMITFTSNKAERNDNDWDRIDLSDVRNETKTTIQFCLMEYCNGGLFCENSSIDIRNNTIKNIGGCGIYCLKSASNIDGDETRRLNITGNRIINGAGSGDAIYLGWYYNALIEDNFVSNYSGIAMRIYSPEKSPIIRNNTLTECYKGMMVQGTNAIIEGNVITYCSYYGIQIMGYSTWISKPVIMNNTMGANGVSIFIHVQCKPLIRYNNFIKDYTYSIEHGGDIDNNASHNFWGTTNRTRIEELICDFYDDYNHAKVLYEPILESMSKGAPYITINRPPVADAGPDLEVNMTELFTLDGSGSYDLEEEPLQYRWRLFGKFDTGWTNDPKTQCSIDDNGLYYATLYVSDGNQTDEDLVRIEVHYVDPEPPVAICTASHEILFKGENLTLDSSGSYDTNGVIVNRSWRSNKEGIIGYEKKIVVKLGLGLHQITLTVTDDDGFYDQDVLYVGIANNNSQVEEEENETGEDENDEGGNIHPVPSINFTKLIIESGDVLTLDGSGSYDPDGKISEHIWSSDIQGVLGTGTSIEVELEPGLHLIELRVIDEQDLSNSTFAAVFVRERTIPKTVPVPPIPTASSSQVKLVGPGMVTLDGSGSYDPDGTIIRYVWNSSIFGQLGEGRTVRVEMGLGTHLISLTVTDNDGIPNSTYLAVSVIEEVPVIPDSDGDGVLDDHDAFPNDPSASIDTDMDGYPDIWNPGKTGVDSTTGLVLDHYPDDSQRWGKEIVVSEKQDGSFLWLMSVALIIIFIVSLFIVIVRGNRNTKDERRLIQLRREINVEGDSGIRRSPTMGRMRKLEEIRKEGSISKSTYREIRDIIKNDGPSERR